MMLAMMFNRSENVLLYLFRPLFAGVEFDTDEDNYRNLGFARKYQFCQWTLASVANSPILMSVAQSIEAKLRDTDHL
jgi:hypothetical protein